MAASSMLNIIPNSDIFLMVTGTDTSSLTTLKLPLLWPTRTGILTQERFLDVGAGCDVSELEELPCGFETTRPTRESSNLEAE